MPSLCRPAGPLGLDRRDQRPPTCCRLCVRDGDGPGLAFLSAELPLARLVQGPLPSAGLGSLDPSGGWREERRLPASRSCALERRVAAMRAMLLVPTAISSRASAARRGLPSLETRLFRLQELGSCRTPAGGQTAGPRLGPQEQTRGQRLKATVYPKGKAALGGGHRPGKAREAARPGLGRPVGQAALRPQGSALRGDPPAPASRMGAPQHLGTGRLPPMGRAALGTVAPMLMAVEVATRGESSF